MPFCPTCRTEYESPTEFCEKCSSKLVDSLPPREVDPEDPRIDLVELSEFATVSEAEMIREILEKNGIPTVLRGEVDPIGIVSHAESITLLVEERFLSQAQELYDAYFAGTDIEEARAGEE